MKDKTNDANEIIPRKSGFFRRNKKSEKIIDATNNTEQEAPASVDHDMEQEPAAEVESKENIKSLPTGDETSAGTKEKAVPKQSKDDGLIPDKKEPSKELEYSDKKTEEAHRRRAGREPTRRQRRQNTPRHSENTVNEEEPQLKKIEAFNFVMNQDGCFINGKPFDPQNPPEGVVIIVDHKHAGSQTQSNKKK